MKLCLIFLIVISAGAGATESHCGKGEIDYLSCTLSNSKVASVCGSILKDPKTFDQLEDAWVQYRMGRIKKIEFIYPASKSGSIGKFEGNYFHPHGEDHQVLDLRFINEEALYSIELVAARKLSGDVSAEFKGKRSTLGCRGPIQSHYWSSFGELIDSISQRNGQTDIYYEYYKKHGK